MQKETICSAEQLSPSQLHSEAQIYVILLKLFYETMSQYKLKILSLHIRESKSPVFL